MPLLRSSNKRNFSTSRKRLSGDHHDDGGIPGAVSNNHHDSSTNCLNLSLQNLPFDIHNRYKFTLLFTAFFASGFGLPFLVVRHQLLKKAA